MGTTAVISRLSGALARAFLVIILIATPSFILPGITSDAAQVVILVAFFAAMMTVLEYASNYPCLVEFRDAPPFNRIRFISLFATVLLLSVMARGQVLPTNLTVIVETIGQIIGHGGQIKLIA